MPGELEINFKKLEELIALVVTKKELPFSKEMSYFGWDGRYELHGKKGAIFRHLEVPTLNAIGLKEEYYNTDYSFIDFDQLLSLYPAAECILDLLGAHRHRDDVQRVAQQISDLSDALKLAIQQKKIYDKDTLNKILICIKKS